MPNEKVSYEELLGLHPPIAPKPIVSENMVGRDVEPIELDRAGSVQPCKREFSATNSKPTIDFSYLTNNSSFQRAIMEFIKKFVPGFENVEARGSKEIMVKSFDINAQNYRECMQELKEKLEKLK